MFIAQISLPNVTFLTLISWNLSLMHTTKEVNPHPSHCAMCQHVECHNWSVCLTRSRRFTVSWLIIWILYIWMCRYVYWGHHGHHGNLDVGWAFRAYYWWRTSYMLVKPIFFCQNHVFLLIIFDPKWAAPKAKTLSFSWRRGSPVWSSLLWVGYHEAFYAQKAKFVLVSYTSNGIRFRASTGGGIYSMSLLVIRELGKVESSSFFTLQGSITPRFILEGRVD